MVVFPRDQDMNRIVRRAPIVEMVGHLFTSFSAGLTYCAIGALAFLNCVTGESVDWSNIASSSGISLSSCARWIISRQTTYLEEQEIEADEQPSQPQPGAVPLPSSPLGSPHATQFPSTDLSSSNSSRVERTQSAKAQVINIFKVDLRCAGFNGRINKIADTCYCFWNTGALAVRNLILTQLLLR